MLFGHFYSGVYRESLSNEWAWRPIWWGWITGLSISLAVLFGLKIPFSRWVFVVASVSFLALSVLDRALIRAISDRWFEGHEVTIVGVGFTDETRKQVRENVKTPYTCQWVHSDELSSSFENIIDLNPDIVLLYVPRMNDETVRGIFDFGSRYQIPVRIVPTATELFLSQTSGESWNQLRLLRSNTHHQLQQQLAMKTLFDYILTVILLIVSLPLLLMVAFLIRFIDGSPVFYKQRRVGRGGSTFDMYKFRTMVQGASNRGPELTGGPDDPRITTLGKWLRRWSLDELPQFFNILKGDMSLVGPRPEVPRITGNYTREERRVLWIRPGLTGLSQVRGRENLDLDRKLEIDQEYLQNYSIVLDLWILLKTFYIVVQGEGAN